MNRTPILYYTRMLLGLPAQEKLCSASPSHPCESGLNKNPVRHSLGVSEATCRTHSLDCLLCSIDQAVVDDGEEGSSKLWRLRVLMEHFLDAEQVILLLRPRFQSDLQYTRQLSESLADILRRRNVSGDPEKSADSVTGMDTWMKHSFTSPWQKHP
jgi:hypothetical protein